MDGCKGVLLMDEVGDDDRASLVSFESNEKYEG